MKNRYLAVFLYKVKICGSITNRILLHRELHMLFIRTGQQEPGSDFRNYIFPYRIGQTKKLFERKDLTWEVSGNKAFEINLVEEYDIYAVKQKLIQLGNSIRARRLPVLALIVSQSEEDVLDVFIKETASNDPNIWLSFAKTLSNAFCLPVKL